GLRPVTVLESPHGERPLIVAAAACSYLPPTRARMPGTAVLEPRFNISDAQREDSVMFTRAGSVAAALDSNGRSGPRMGRISLPQRQLADPIAPGGGAAGIARGGGAPTMSRPRGC